MLYFYIYIYININFLFHPFPLGGELRNFGLSLSPVTKFQSFLTTIRIFFRKHLAITNKILSLPNKNFNNAMGVDKVTYWKELADYDVDTAEVMYNGGRWLYVGFMC